MATKSAPYSNKPNGIVEAETELQLKVIAEHPEQTYLM